MSKNVILKWAPALVMMIVIFVASAQPSDNLPNFDWADKIVKKFGHMLGYALLAVSYWFGLGLKRERLGWAWILAILYAATDEFHQTFVSGRGASALDVLLFDNLGALIGLFLTRRFAGKSKPTIPSAVDA